MVNVINNEFSSLVDFLKTAKFGTPLGYDHTTISCNLEGLRDDQEQLDCARLALDMISLVTGLKFVETVGEADIDFDNEENGAYCENKEVTETNIVRSFVNIEKDWMIYAAEGHKWSVGSYGLQTFIHEICHALGLYHAGPYNGTGDYEKDRLFDSDTWQYSIMSYFSQSSYKANDASDLYLIAPMIADLKALRDIYGPLAVNEGNTTYGKDATVWKGLTDIGANPASTFCINDTGGYDVVDFSNITVDNLIDLRPGYFSDVGGRKGNVSISVDTTIEEARGGSARDTVNGNTVDNRLLGMKGNDSLYGMEGNDTLLGGEGADLLNGGSGIDTADYSDASGGVVADLALSSLNKGDALGDTFVSIENLTGSAFGDELNGDSANNVLEGGAGGDRLSGGGGNDTASYAHAGAGVTANLTDPSRNAGEATGDSYQGVENLRGSAFGDALTGNDGDNILDGCDGSDRLDGGRGNDTYVLGSGADTVTDSGGVDTITSTITRTLLDYATIENLILNGSGPADGTGNRLDNTILGNDAANRLDGGAGRDVLSGGAGNDTYVLCADYDTVNDSTGIDTITSTISRSLLSYAAIENLILLGTASINGTGNARDNVITGNIGANRLEGGAGKDTLIGSSGNDIYVLGAEFDTVVDSAGIDTIQSTATRSLISYAAIENLTLLGSGMADATGNALANVLVGNNGTNRLDGGLGNDTLTGGGGKDSFVFSTPFRGMQNIDTITDFSVRDDTILIAQAMLSGMKTGALAPNAFVSNITGVATRATDRIVYESDTGKLFYDINGSAAGGSFLLANLTKNLALTAQDFLII